MTSKIKNIVGGLAAVMMGLVGLVGAVAVVFVLAMRQAPLWLWAAAAGAATLACRTGIFSAGGPADGSLGLFRDLIWLPFVVLALLSAPTLRRRLLVAPAYTAVRRILPKVSDTEAQALDAGTIGFDAEIFSGRPDWAKLRAIPGIELLDCDCVGAPPASRKDVVLVRNRDDEEIEGPVLADRWRQRIREAAGLVRVCPLSGTRRPNCLP